jgi:hypothetical protein
MKIAFIAVVSSLLAACASTGLYNMSDEWCTAHLDASAARCPQNEVARRVAVNERHQAADSEGAASE